ncbi:MAG: tRNA adenosine(34) deaminase TadA [Clostridia bacterium]|nr:tRNA adenosine(34) deaminase TadA [Clostridia bacterium]
MNEIKNDEYFMREAIKEAEIAASIGEVPIGAVVVRNGEIIARAHNERETGKDATRHAEIIAIERACAALHGWRLIGCDLYVTLEPCPMCAGATVNARIVRVIYGASDLRAGAFGSIFNLNDYPVNHKPEIVRGVLADECLAPIQAFFKERRKK